MDMKTRRLTEIDLYRFMAALSVVVYHYAFRGEAADGMTTFAYPLLSSAAKYGHYGVELFFMISGFVILMSAQKGGFWDFCVSRMVRLYPAFWCCCSITFLFTLWLGAPVYLLELKEYLVNLTMIHELFHVKSVDGVYWTLVVEIKFYFLIGVLLLCKKIHLAQQAMVLWLIASVIIEVIFPNFVGHISLLSFSSYFVAGTFFYYVWAFGMTRKRAIVLAAALIISLCRALRNLEVFEAHYKVDMNEFIVVLIILSLFSLMLLTALQKMTLLARVNWLYLGVMTYPLYLLHQNIGYMIFNRLDGLLNPHLLFWAVIVVMMIAAYTVHLLVERRFASTLKLILVNTVGYVMSRLAGGRDRRLVD